MNTTKVSINNLTSAIQDIIKDYTDEMQSIVEDATEKCTTQALKEIKNVSPQDTGKYKKGWRKKIEKGRFATNGVVYNATDYQIIHLLEFGHANVHGGRTLGRTPAHPHVAAINEEVAQRFILEVTSKI